MNPADGQTRTVTQSGRCSDIFTPRRRSLHIEVQKQEGCDEKATNQRPQKDSKNLSV